MDVEPGRMPTQWWYLVYSVSVTVFILFCGKVGVFELGLKNHGESRADRPVASLDYSAGRDVEKNATSESNDAALSAKKVQNMNGLYRIENPVNHEKHHNTDYASKGYKYFDTYSPEINSTYGEVFWTDLPQLKLPENIRAKFQNGTIAIMGYEHDQVIVDGKAGEKPELDVSVPFSWAYNHHYMIFMTGRDAEMILLYIRKDEKALEEFAKKHFPYDDNARHMVEMMASDLHMKKPHNSTHDRLWIPILKRSRAGSGAGAEDNSLTKPLEQEISGAAVQTEGVQVQKNGFQVQNHDVTIQHDDTIPSSQFFSEANGGESRKSYHGYPEGYAQLVKYPESWHVFPMQIDTRNRACGITRKDVVHSKNCPITPEKPFYPGPEPKSTSYINPSQPADQKRNAGILECPCTSSYGGDFAIYGEKTKTKSTSHIHVVAGRRSCEAANHGDHTHGDSSVLVNTECFNAGWDLLKSFNKAGAPSSIQNITVPVEQFSAYPVGCSISFENEGKTAKVFWNHLASRSMKGAITSLLRKSSKTDGNKGKAVCSSSQTRRGHVDFSNVGIQMSLELNDESDDVKITLTGPKDVWFGVAFNAVLMADQPWTILIIPTKGGDEPAEIREQHIGTCGEEAQHCAGDQLPTSVAVQSNILENENRKVVLTRKRVGISKKHYTFDTIDQSTVNVMSAIGSGSKFSYHRAHQKAKITLWDDKSFNCVCVDGEHTGGLCDHEGKNCETFVKRVAPPCSDDKHSYNPYKDHDCGSLEEQQNPTRTSATYIGGLQCCKHRRHLLDIEQANNPEITGETLRYHMKIRWWYQEYVPAGSGTSNAHGVSSTKEPSHHDLLRLYYQTEAEAGEYDVPPAFRHPDMRQVPGYPDWPLNVPTPGTTCTGSKCNGEDVYFNGNPDCKCEHTIKYKWRLIPKSLRQLPQGKARLSRLNSIETAAGHLEGQGSTVERHLIPAKTKSNQEPATHSDFVRLIYANGHCHAPSCLSLELYRNDTEHPMQLLCRQQPVFGTGNVLEDRFEEKGYITIPPCLWSGKYRDPKEAEEKEQLNPAVVLPYGVPMVSIKKNDNTMAGHYGEMSSWQMRGVMFK